MSFEKIGVTEDHPFLTGIIKIAFTRLPRSLTTLKIQDVAEYPICNLANLVCATPEILNLVQKNEPLRHGFIWFFRATTKSPLILNHFTLKRETIRFLDALPP